MRQYYNGKIVNIGMGTFLQYHTYNTFTDGLKTSSIRCMGGVLSIGISAVIYEVITHSARSNKKC